MWWKYLLAASGGAIFGYLLCCLMAGLLSRGNREKPPERREAVWQVPPIGFLSGGVIPGDLLRGPRRAAMPMGWEKDFKNDLAEKMREWQAKLRADAIAKRIFLNMHDPARHADVVRRGIAALQEAGSL